MRLVIDTINSLKIKANTGNKNSENKNTNSGGKLPPFNRLKIKNEPPTIIEITQDTKVITMDLARKICPVSKRYRIFSHDLFDFSE
jgi:hypothetical protein